MLEQLERVLASAGFQGAARSRALLTFLVEQTVGGRTERLKEYTIAVEAMQKGEDFDPRTDPIVRAEASRLRGRLERYYAADGRDDPVLIVLPKGSYAPQILPRQAGEPVPQPSADPQQTIAPHRGRDRWLWLGAGLVTGVALAAVLGIGDGWRRPAESAPQAALQFEVELQAGRTLGSDVGTNVVIAPDGTRLVFVVMGEDGIGRLATRRLDQDIVTEFPDTLGARVPFFSPDGSWVGFWASGRLQKVAIDGGAPIVLCDATTISGASWGEDGQIIAALGGTLSRVPSSGGEPTVILDLGKDGVDPRWPQVLPGGRYVLFTAVGPMGPNSATIQVLSLADGRTEPLLQGGTFGRYVSGGYLTYVNQGTLFAVPFDPERGGPVTVMPSPVLNDVAYSATFGYAQFDASRTGTFVFRRSPGARHLVPTWIEADGALRPWPIKPGEYTFPRLSPDGLRLALALTEAGVTQMWLAETDGDRLGPLSAGEYGPTWSPDGQTLITGTLTGLRWTSLADPNVSSPLLTSNAVQIPWSFSPDGTRLAFHAIGPQTGFDLWTVPITRTESGVVAGTPEPFLRTPAYETYPAFSPDGRWIAYGSGGHGRWDVYVRPFPDDGRGEVRISETTGRIPMWMPNGRELLYRTNDQRLMVVPYEVKDGAFVAGHPRPWTSHALGETGVIANFDVDPATGRVLALMPSGAAGPPQRPGHVTVRLNAADEIGRKMADR